MSRRASSEKNTILNVMWNNFTTISYNLLVDFGGKLNQIPYEVWNDIKAQKINYYDNISWSELKNTGLVKVQDQYWHSMNKLEEDWNKTVAIYKF